MSSKVMICAAAREIKDGEMVFVGMRLPLLAFMLAKKLHAPRAIGLFENGVVRDAPAQEMLYTMSDGPNLHGAVCCTTLLDVMSLMQQGRVALGFLGAAEVDQYGNLNSTQVRRPDGGVIRLPGSGGACDIACLSGRVATVIRHEKHRLVPRVSYITSPAPPGGVCLITDKAVFRSHAATGILNLVSCHPGVSFEEIQSETSWTLKDPQRETPPPSPQEINILEQIDRQGFWVQN
ncbi:MAG: CoA-transferase [Acidobacteria bacterium]|nr:CoA-transferase [Acidobacteriota bacterium]